MGAIRLTKTKSPFQIFPEFVSPLMCEEIVDALDFGTPDTDNKGGNVSSSKFNEDYEMVLFEEFVKIKPQIEQHYSIAHKATCETRFDWYPEGSTGKLVCESAEYLRKKWVRVRDRDLSCLVFLSDWNDTPNFDDDYEVYGGKIEFPQHGFGFNAQRGTMIVYPSGPHFINTVTQVQAGNLHIAKFHIKSAVPYLYNPADFPGDYRSWFVDVV